MFDYNHLYRLLTYCLHPFTPMLLKRRAKSQQAYKERIGERLGYVSLEISRPCLVIHGASLGEINGLRFFVNQCINHLANHDIVVTSFTPAGSEQIRRLFGSKVKHCYLPIDTPQATKRFINTIKPRAIVFMETEIWPNLTLQASRQDTKLIIINGRISEKSFNTYQKFRSLTASTLVRYRLILTQSEKDSERFIELGALQHNTKNFGNIKFDSAPTPNAITENSITRFDRLVWLVASSHGNEEEFIFETYKKLRQTYNDLLLILAPRHKERFSPCKEAILNAGLSFVSRSNAETPTENTNIWLIDTIGELLQFYPIADLVTVAGSFNNTGGHNVLEPGAFGLPVTVGPNMKNSQPIVDSLLENQALYQHSTTNSDKVAAEINDLLSNFSKRMDLGQSIQQFIESQRGASARCVAALLNAL